MKNINLSEDLSMPLDIAGEAIGVLATRGAGKSFTSAVIVEELWDAGIQFAVLDPTGVYWGLRAAANGKDEGLPVIVLGGPHGDVPLESTAGSLVADLLINTGQSLILDLSDLPTKSAQTHFVTDFCERLYRNKARNRNTLHLIVDEADEFAPQKPMGKEAMMLHNMEMIVRRGRSRGLGTTLITQRSATLNKNVLDLIDTLIAMRVGSPRDRKAVESWITVKALQDEAGMMDSLPSLPTGTAWVWSPVRDILKNVGIRRIRTFDSYATPKPGQKRAEPKAMAMIDLNLLGEQIKATAERAKENDPKALKARIRSLEHELSKKPAPKENTTKIEVPVISDKQIKELNGLYDRADRVFGKVSAISDLIFKAQGQIMESIKEREALRRQMNAPTTKAAPVSVKPEKNIPDNIPDNRGITRPQKHLLDTLAMLESIDIRKPSRAQLALWAGVSPTSGGYFNNLGALRSSGLIDYPSGGTVALNVAGRELAEPHATPTMGEMHGSLYARVGTSKAAILRALIEIYPKDISKEKLAEYIGVSSTSGGYFNNLGALRTLGIIDYPRPGHVAALPVLFLE